MSHLYVSRLLRTLFIVLAVQALTAAQDIRNPESAVDNQMRTDMHVDPISHALQFQIPMGQYPGRGGTSLPITLYYSSKLWNIKYKDTLQCIDDAGSLYRAEYAHTSAAGWTSSLDGFSLPPDISLELYDGYTTRPKNSSSYLQKIARMFVTLPDGSRHELRKDDNFHSYNENITGLFYAVDGSRLVYDTTTGTLFLPDGSRYVTTSSGQTYIDRNGNQLSYNATNRQWTDSLGRTIGLPLPASWVGDHVGLSEQEYTYSIPGIGNSSLTYTFRWKHLSTAGVMNEQDSQALRYKGDHTTNCQSGTDYSGLFHSNESDYNGIQKSNLFDPVVLYQIVLPTGQAYTFKYNIYGEIAKVIYPTGGYERFAYGPAPMLSAEDAVGIYAQANRGVTNVWISPDGTLAGESATPWTYSGFSTIAPNGTRTDRSVFINTQDWSAYGFEDPRLGRVYDERTYSVGGQMLRRKLTEYAVDGPPPISYANYWAYKQRNPRPIKEVEILLDTGASALSATTTYQYDADLNPIVINHYDFVSVDQTTAQTQGIGSIPQGNTLLRSDEATFLVNDANIDPSTRYAYRARNLVVLPTSMRIKDGAGNVLAQRYVNYDESAYPLLNYGSVTGWSDPGTTVRGNATTSGVWVNTSNSYLQTHAQYDQSGSIRNSWDATGNQSQVEYSSTYAYAYPTLTRSAVPDSSGSYGSTTALVSTSTYDFNTGLVSSKTDANGQVTTYTYDSLARLTQVNFPDGGRTTRNYVNNHPCGAMIETRILLDSSGRETDSWQFFDQLGRPYLTETLDNQDANNPYLRVDTQYDSMGRVYRVSNPYRSSGCTATPNPSGWTDTGFDVLGRITSVTAPDSSMVTTGYSGNTVTVTDQAGKKRRSITDALGRLIRVDEPDVNGNLDVGGTPVQSTSYTYDALGNLRRVDQGSQQRFFMYDSLSRLIRAKNPEQAAGSAASNMTDSITGNNQWSMAYGYDNNGNLTARVDARDVTTNYAYDALNRNYSVTYSDGTPTVYRYYDLATNGRGRLYWDQAVGVSANAIDSYDSMGRPLQAHQVFWVNGTWGNYFNLARTYDKAGHVLTQTNPSGRTVNYGYDVAGRLNTFTGNLGDGVSRTYSTGVTYSEFGGLQQEQFGTQTPLYHKMHYNVRGQMYDMRLSTSSWASDEWNWNRGAILNWYDSTSNFPYQSPNSGTNNNGSVLRQETFVPDNDQISSYSYQRQNYAYDSLNRLSSVTEFANGTTQSFVQAYAYDRFGNRTIDQNQTSAVVPHPNYTADTSNNRLIAPAGYNYGYDNAGNQTNDNYTGQGQRTYDAENRMKQAWANNQWQTYTYDADGHRIKRNVNGVETWQVYGIDGELLGEYAAGAAPFVATTEYGYRRGELLVTVTNGDTQRLTRFVTNLYYGAKQRDPSSAELQDGVNQLATAGATSQAQLLTVASQLARSLFTSTSYETSPYRSDLQYTADLYYTYLQRGPDDGGLNWWAGQVPANGRANICTAFEVSGEFQTLVANLYGTATSDNERTEHFVNNFYRGAYGVDATSTQIQQQRDALNAAAAQSQSAVQAQAETFGRSLFAGQINDSSISDTQFVTNLYEAFLQRGPDGGGLGWWSGQATVGQGRQNVLSAFATCTAFRDLSATLYREANWIVTDHLGTPRMIATKSGSLAGMKRHDYLPFGEELSANTGGRTTTQGYAGDNARQKFTSYERDSESGLDYAHARYYSFAQGRFTGADIPLMDQYTNDPKSWNLYSYVGNRPLNYTDPFGLWKKVKCEGALTQCWQAEKGDTVETLAKKLHVSADELNKFFQNTPVAIGDILDVSRFGGNNAPVPQAPTTYLEVIVWNLSVNHGIAGVGGHVSYNINGTSWSWERGGWHKDSFDNYLRQNSYRDGVGYVLEDENDPAWAEQLAKEIQNFHGDGNSWIPTFGPYGLLKDNCGEAFCRAVNQMGLPRNDAVKPVDHRAYILQKLRPYIRAINNYNHGSATSRPVPR